jgi:hypothetical protein
LVCNLDKKKEKRLKSLNPPSKVLPPSKIENKENKIKKKKKKRKRKLFTKLKQIILSNSFRFRNKTV